MSETSDPKQNDGRARTITRRKFILGVIAGGAAVSAASYRFLAPAHGRMSTADSGERLITLNVNGKPRRVDVMKQETLAWTLRYKLGLTGTKLGCDRAECGACTVLLDDVPHYSCSVLTHTVRDKQGDHHRRAGGGRRQAAPGAAGGGGRAGIPVRVLHVGLHHVGGRIPEARIPIPRGRRWRTASPATCAGARTTTRFSTRMMRGAEYMRTGAPWTVMAGTDMRT